MPPIGAKVIINPHEGVSRRDGEKYKTVKVGLAGSRSAVNVSSWARYDLLEELAKPANMARLLKACQAELPARGAVATGNAPESAY